MYSSIKIVGFTNVAGRLAASASCSMPHLFSFIETLVDKSTKQLAVAMVNSDSSAYESIRFIGPGLSEAAARMLVKRWGDLGESRKLFLMRTCRPRHQAMRCRLRPLLSGANTGADPPGEQPGAVP